MILEIFLKNCMKSKNFEGWLVTRAPLDPPMISDIFCTELTSRG